MPHFLLPKQRRCPHGTSLSKSARERLVKVPKVDTYVFQIQECQEMCSKLKLDRPISYSVPNTPFPLLRNRTMLLSSETRLPAYGTSKFRPISLRSAPVLAWEDSEIHVELGNHERDKNSDSDKSVSDYGHHSDVYHSNHVKTNQTQKRNKMDPLRLSEYLKEHGFGYPLLLTSSHKQRRMSAVLPPGVRVRKLPSNPSKREKIKGRARLDQEIANMRAMAFCEQQTPKVFRTASANMENRDVQFVEDEMREHLHTEEMIEDDTGSVTMMPIRKDELFKRIDTWLDGVCDAFRTNTSKENIQKQG